MSANHQVSNLLTILRNGQLVRLAEVKAPYSRMNKNMLQVLKDEGYIKDFSEVEAREGIKEIAIQLKYFEGKAVIQKIETVSKPGRRVYTEIGKLPKVANGLGISILSTSKGILADHQARTQNVGGEVLCNVF